MEGILAQHPLFVQVIKKNRTARSIDRIVCCNSKCVYECVWEQTGDGQPVCIFALNLYDWTALADTDNYPKRGCVGMYMPASGRPAIATVGTRLEFPVPNFGEAGPFRTLTWCPRGRRRLAKVLAAPPSENHPPHASPSSCGPCSPPVAEPRIPNTEHEAVIVAIVDAEHLEPGAELIGVGEDDGGHDGLRCTT